MSLSWEQNNNTAGLAAPRLRNGDRAGFEKREKRRNIRQLQTAISQRDLSLVKSILSTDFDVDFQYNGQTSLQLAVCQGTPDICSLLIAKGANVNQTNADGNSLLNMACWRGFTDVADILVNSGADVNSWNESGNTPLNACAFKGFSHIAEVLLSAKCDINLHNEKGHTPLYCVSRAGNTAMVQQLIKAGADLDWGDLAKKTPLMAAAEEGHLQVVKALLEGGASVNRQSQQGRTAAFEAASCGHKDILHELISHNADLNLATTKGYTPLIEGISRNQTGAAQILIQSPGCDVNLADRTHTAPIHAAIRQVSNMFDPDNTAMRDLVEALVDAGADVNKFDAENWTPLYQAASAGDLDVILNISKEISSQCEPVVMSIEFVLKYRGKICRLLLKKGAAVDSVTKHGSTILHAAVYGGKFDVVKLCLDAGCKVNAVDDEGRHALMAALSCRCDIKIIEILVDAGSDLSLAHKLTKKTALHEAIYQHYVPAAHLLIDRGSSLTAIDHERKSPLFLACQRGLCETVAYMFSKGNCPTASPHASALPIHAAASQGRASIIQILSDHGCDLNQMNEKGETPIMTALAEDCFSSVRALLQCGCDLEAQNKVKGLQVCCIFQEDPHPHLGLEPLFLALTHKNVPMMKMLLQCYCHIPSRTIRMLTVLLKQTQGLNVHYTPQQKEEIFNVFTQHLLTPFSLADACRRCIRVCLGSPIQTKVKHLPVGEKVRNYILMESEFETWHEIEQDMPGGSSGFSDVFVGRQSY